MIPQFKFRGQQLDKEQSEMCLKLLLTTRHDPSVEKPFQEDVDLMNEFPAKVIAKRIEHYPLPFNITNLFLVMSLFCGFDSPGKWMCLLWIVHNVAKARNQKLFTLENWCEMFPWGTPTEEEFQTWWDSQKDEHGNNRVDNPQEWAIESSKFDVMAS
jgi:hypothetical protein